MASIITITGDLGSGKSTVSEILCKRLGYSYIYTGKIQREIAERYDMTTLELNRYSETHPEIDAEIDATFLALGEQSDLVVDSRMAWHFIPNSFKVYLATDLMVAAQRISGDMARKNEKYVTLEDAAAQIQARKISENKRYLDLYGVDCADFANFDLIVNTSDFSPEEVADIIIREYSQL